MEISIAIGDQSRVATNISNLGNAYLSLGKCKTATEFFEKGLAITTAIGDQSGRASNSGHLGTVYSCLEEYGNVITYYEKALEINTTIGDQSRIANNNRDLGNAHLSLGQYKHAIENYEKYLEINCDDGDQSKIANSNGNLGNAYCRFGKHRKAIKYYEKGLEISIGIGDQSGIASNNANLGKAYLSLGQFKNAIEYLERGLEISTAIGNRSGIACNNENLGIVYLSLGECRKAIEYFEKGLEISSVLGDQSRIASNNGNLGNAYRCLGEYGKAISYCKKALEISTAIRDEPGIASNNEYLGNAYVNLGQYKKAIEFYKKSLEISTEMGDQLGMAKRSGNLGIAYLSLRDYEKAIKYYEKGLKLSSDMEDWSGIAANNGNLANAYLRLGQYKKAIEYYEKGLEISSAIGDKSVMANDNTNLGNAYVCLGQNEKAIEYIEKGLKISTEIGDNSGIATKNGNLGNAYHCIGQYKTALSYLETSIKQFDRMFLDMVPDQSKLSYARLYFDIYELSMACLLAVENYKAALLVLDRGRDKELHFCLRKQKEDSNKSMEEYGNSVCDRINAGEEDRELKELEITLQNETCSTTTLVFAFDLENFLNVWIFNESLIHRKLIATREELFQHTIGCLRELNVSVDREHSFLKFDVPPVTNGCIMLPIEMQKEKSSSKPGEEILPDHVILQKMFQAMIDPLKDLIQGDKLLIVPDGPLFFAPFSCLINEHGGYLSESYSIQITPSLHSLKASMEKAHDPNLDFALFLGNPAIGEVSLHGELFTPPDLPMAAEEVKCVANLFQATPIVGLKAQKQVLLELLDKASIIHIAAHGEPTCGEILLAPNPSQVSSTSPSSSQESFLLTQQDVMNISVKARLVVLSCCHTGQGEVSSEGVIGITRAFLTAGARSVLSTLWPINDSATKVFMEKFYEELCQETSLCEALRRTKNIFQKHEDNQYKSFEIWAPFTIYGEDVKFKKDEIEKIKKESRKFFDGFVILS